MEPRLAYIRPILGMTRRFPPPWPVEQYNDTCFIVRNLLPL
jgi:hypothetical protein